MQYFFASNEYLVEFYQNFPNIYFRVYDIINNAWKIIPIDNSVHGDVFISAFFEGDIMVGLVDKYLHIINVRTEEHQLIDLNELTGDANMKILVGFQNRNVFIGEVLRQETNYQVLIKKVSIDNFEIRDINTVTIDDILNIKVLVAYNGDHMLYSKSGKIYSIISLTRNQAPLFYIDLSYESTIVTFQTNMNSTNPKKLSLPFIVNRNDGDIVLFQGESRSGLEYVYYAILGKDGIYPLEYVDSDGHDIWNDIQHDISERF